MIGRSNEPKIVIDGFPHGVNELSNPTHLRPGELADVKNMVLRDGRSLQSRLGQTGEHNRVYQPLAHGCRLLHRYKSLANDKRLLIVSGGKMYADTTDNRKFDYVVSITGTPASQQFYDSVLFCSDEYELSAWRPDTGVERPEMDPPIPSFFWGGSGPSGITSGGSLPDKVFTYRFTFDISIGDTFLGETGALRFYYSPLGMVYYFTTVDFSAGASDDNYVYFVRPSDSVVNQIPDYVSAINFYRSPPLDAAPVSPTYDVEDDYGLFWIGSISMDDVRAAAKGDTLFTDYGSVSLGKQIRKTPLDSPPRSKRLCMHKGRLWVASPSIRGNDETDWTYYPDLIAYSAFEANGTEPLVFFPESTVAVGAGEPDEITGIRSWRNQTMLVWKANKIYAVLGGDDELDFGIPNISIQLIDPNVGCIAPNTICEVDGGIAWLSNRGPYIFDGTAPRPLYEHKVRKASDSIPASRRTKACAVYDSKNREYTIFYTAASDTAAFNRSYMTYSFATGTWMKGKLERGVNLAMEVRDADDKSYVLWGLEDNTGTMLTSTPLIMRAESGFVEGFDYAPLAPDQNKVDFSVDFGFLDGGHPWLDKKFKEIVVEATSSVPLTLDLLVDNKYDSRLAGNSISMGLPSTDETLVWDVGKWDEKKWANQLQGYVVRATTRNLDTLPVGKSIRPIISGVNAYDPVEIHSITIYYEPKEGTRT